MRTVPAALALMTAILTPTLAFAEPKTDVQSGVEAWSRGDYPSAVKSWRPLAISGDADAQFNLGQAYKLGRGVPADLKQAEDWYRKAALQGHWQAEDNYGLVMFQNGNRQQALPWIEKSTARGEARAQYILGTALFNGDIVPKDWPRAYALMTRASAAGLAPASASLAQMDRYIPVDQRQSGLAMARAMEMATARPIVPQGAATQITPTRPVEPRTGAIRPIDLPPSQKALAPVDVQRPQPRPAAITDTATGKNWRVQLGAFGEESRARLLFKSLQARVPGLSAYQPLLIKAGTVTRLQVGPIANAQAAEKLCATVRAAGNACLTIAP